MVRVMTSVMMRGILKRLLPFSGHVKHRVLTSSSDLVNLCIFVGVRCQDRGRVVDHFQGHGLVRSTSWGILLHEIMCSKDLGLQIYSPQPEPTLMDERFTVSTNTK